MFKNSYIFLEKFRLYAVSMLFFLYTYNQVPSANKQSAAFWNSFSNSSRHTFQNTYKVSLAR